MRSFVRFLSVMLILSLVLAGCGGGKSEKKGVAVSGESKTAATTPAPVETKAGETAAAPAQKEITVKLASSSRDALKHVMFNFNSFGKDQGVSLEWKQYKGGSKAAQALLAREVDVAVLQTEHVMGDTSGELRMIALLTQGPGNVLLVDSKYKDQIKSVKDLQGKKVGVSSTGSGTHQFLLALLDRRGIDPSSINVLPKGLIAPKIFAEGEVVATVTIEPYASQVIKSGAAFALVDTRRAEGIQEVYGVDALGWIALVTRADVLEERGPEMARLTEAVQQSLRRIASEDIEALVADSPDYMFPDGDRDLYAKMLEQNRSVFVADGKVTEKLLGPVWADMQAKGAVPKDKSLDLSQFVASAK
ncbi:MAG: ABC transporter substrate-binding protein [Bacillota bacterium]